MYDRFGFNVERFSMLNDVCFSMWNVDYWIPQC